MKGFPSPEVVALLRSRYPTGTRIKLVHMQADPRPVDPGTRGTVTFVDDAGTIHMKWDNGRSLGLIPSVDKFHKI